MQIYGESVLIISSSPVPGGKANSGMLCEAFARGARECGHAVEIVALRDRQINFCPECQFCVQKGEGYIRKSSGKKAHFIAMSAGADTEQNHLAANESFRGFLRCLRTVEEGGVLNAGGAYAPGSNAGKDWLNKAYEMEKTE